MTQHHEREDCTHVASAGKVQNPKFEVWFLPNAYGFRSIMKSGTVCTGDSGEQLHLGTVDLEVSSSNPNRKSVEICGPQGWT